MDLENCPPQRGAGAGQAADQQALIEPVEGSTWKASGLELWVTFRLSTGYSDA